MSFPNGWSWLPPVLTPGETVIRSSHMMQVRAAIDYLLRRAQDKNDPIARATYASTAGYATNAGHANNADYATNAGHATVADAIVGGGSGGGSGLAQVMSQVVVVVPQDTVVSSWGSYDAWYKGQLDLVVTTNFRPDIVMIKLAQGTKSLVPDCVITGSSAFDNNGIQYSSLSFTSNDQNGSPVTLEDYARVTDTGFILRAAYDFRGNLGNLGSEVQYTETAYLLVTASGGAAAPPSMASRILLGACDSYTGVGLQANAVGAVVPSAVTLTYLAIKNG